MGFVVAAGPVEVRGRFMVAHVGNLLGSAVGLGLAHLWHELRLSHRQARAAFWMLLLASYSGWLLNLADAILDLPGPATTPSLQPSAAQAAVMVPLLVAAIVGFVGSGSLVVYGLRGRARG